MKYICIRRSKPPVIMDDEHQSLDFIRSSEFDITECSFFEIGREVKLAIRFEPRAKFIVDDEK